MSIGVGSSSINLVFLIPGTTAENLWYNSIMSIVDTHYSRGSLPGVKNRIAHKERTHDAAWVLFTCKEKRDSMIEKVRIDTAEYAVKVVDEPILLDGRDCAGIIDYVKTEIKLKEDIAEKRLDVLMHEIVHGILIERNINDKIPTDDLELVVDEFAKGMLNVMRDNPDLLRLVSKSQV